MRLMAILSTALLLTAGGALAEGTSDDRDLGGDRRTLEEKLAPRQPPAPRPYEYPCHFGPATMRIDPANLSTIMKVAKTRREAWLTILQMPEDPNLEPFTFMVVSEDDGKGEGLVCRRARSHDEYCNFGPITKRVDYRDVEDILATSETRREAWRRIQVMTERPELPPISFVVHSPNDGLGDGLACEKSQRRR